MNHTEPLSFDSLRHKAVVSLNDGERIGYVEDLLLDLHVPQLAGLLVKGDRGESMLPQERIQSIGADAVTIDSVSSTQSSPPGFPDVRAFSTMHDLNVVDATGSLVGELHDIGMDPKTGAVLFLEVKSGGVFGLGAHIDRIPISDVRGFGDKLITVQSHASSEK